MWEIHQKIIQFGGSYGAGVIEQKLGEEWQRHNEVTDLSVTILSGNNQLGDQKGRTEGSDSCTQGLTQGPFESFYGMQASHH